MNQSDSWSASSPPAADQELVADSTTSLAAADFEPSDLPMLRRQHVTAGYRDGLSMSKANHIQRGFDAGYATGAQLGMRAGTILGILEGIIKGLESQTAAGAAGSGSRLAPKMKNAKQREESPTPQVGHILENSSGEGFGARQMDDGSVEKLKQMLLEMYRRAGRELDLQAIFKGFNNEGLSSAEKALQWQATEGGQLPEMKLGKVADEAISIWEKDVGVSRWEEIMDALELNT